MEKGHMDMPECSGRWAELSFEVVFWLWFVATLVWFDVVSWTISDLTWKACDGLLTVIRTISDDFVINKVRVWFLEAFMLNRDFDRDRIELVLRLGWRFVSSSCLVILSLLLANDDSTDSKGSTCESPTEKGESEAT